MNFLLTSFIYPIKEQFKLSKNLNIFLDNPRSEEEIEIIAKYIKYSETSEAPDYHQNFILPLNNEHEKSTIKATINNFFKKYSIKDSYVKRFYDQNTNEDIFRIISKMWIIARYDDKGQLEKLKEERKFQSQGGFLGLIALDEDELIVKSSKELVNFTYLLSLLIHTENDKYWGRSFILHHHRNAMITPKLDKSLNLQFLYFCDFCAKNVLGNGIIDWLFYPFIKEKLYNVTKEMDKLLDDISKEKFLYIANLLKVASKDIEDKKFKLIVLVSIIELLLTHSPDYNRYNVEDSIRKQFILKTSILVHINNKSRYLDVIKKKLDDIYNQRSRIVHGNFKINNKPLKEKNGKDYYDNLISNLYEYIRAILEEYIKDRDFVEFLKKN